MGCRVGAFLAIASPRHEQPRAALKGSWRGTGESHEVLGNWGRGLYNNGMCWELWGEGWGAPWNDVGWIVER